jgi:hypothetical protein
MEEADSFETLIPTYQDYEQASVTVTLGTCTREALGSNLGPDIGYPDGGSLWCPQFSPSSTQIPGQYLEQATASSFQILDKSPFIDHLSV